MTYPMHTEHRRRWMMALRQARRRRGLSLYFSNLEGLRCLTQLRRLTVCGEHAKGWILDAVTSITGLTSLHLLIDQPDSGKAAGPASSDTPDA